MDTQTFLTKVEELSKLALEKLEAASNIVEFTEVENTFLGRKSEFINLIRSIKDLPVEDRAKAGNIANDRKLILEGKFSEKKTQLAHSDNEYVLDPTAPGVYINNGHIHLTTEAIRKIAKIFERIGFYRVRYPEVEWDWYAFGSLNFPDNHPARDDWETFFIDQSANDKKLGRRLLTPHTSSGQVREMESGRMPIRMMNISKTYRRQIDVSHTPMFHQFEGLVIDKDITIANLKGVLDYFVKEFFGPDRVFRIRPYNFRFTEPSFEIDVSVPKESKIGKRGWLELGGAGMVHPKVLMAGGIDPSQYSGFAFGWGVERNIAIPRKIEDIRTLYQNDIRFLEQF